MEELLRVGGGERLQVGRPSHHRLPVRVGNKRGRQELLDQPPGRLALGTHPALLVDYVALFVELAHHGVEEPLRVEIGPKFDAVGGKRKEVASLLVAGEGVQALATFTLHNLAKGFFDDVLVSRSDGSLPSLLELGHLLFVAAHFLAAFAIVGGVSPLNLHERELLRHVVCCADLVRSLEGHVLEHVGQAGDSGDFPVRPDIHVGEKGEDRSLVSLANDYR